MTFDKCRLACDHHSNPDTISIFQKSPSGSFQSFCCSLHPEATRAWISSTMNLLCPIWNLTEMEIMLYIFCCVWPLWLNTHVCKIHTCCCIFQYLFVCFNGFLVYWGLLWKSCYKRSCWRLVLPVFWLLLDIYLGENLLGQGVRHAHLDFARDAPAWLSFWSFSEVPILSLQGSTSPSSPFTWVIPTHPSSPNLDIPCQRALPTKAMLSAPLTPAGQVGGLVDWGMKSFGNQLAGPVFFKLPSVELLPRLHPLREPWMGAGGAKWADTKLNQIILAHSHRYYYGKQ